jgi:type I restriction enzyme S subunit
VPYYGATVRSAGLVITCLTKNYCWLAKDGAPFFDKTKAIAYIIVGKSWVNNHAHVLRALSEVTSNFTSSTSSTNSIFTVT